MFFFLATPFARDRIKEADCHLSSSVDGESDYKGDRETPNVYEICSKRGDYIDVHFLLQPLERLLDIQSGRDIYSLSREEIACSAPRLKLRNALLNGNRILTFRSLEYAAGVQELGA